MRLQDVWPQPVSGSRAECLLVMKCSFLVLLRSGTPGQLQSTT